MKKIILMCSMVLATMGTYAQTDTSTNKWKERDRDRDKERDENRYGRTTPNDSGSLKRHTDGDHRDYNNTGGTRDYNNGGVRDAKGTCTMQMVDGQMVMSSRGGKHVPMEKEMILTNGTAVLPDGTVKTENGGSWKLKEGECLDSDGRKVMDKTKKMKKTTHEPADKPMDK